MPKLLFDQNLSFRIIRQIEKLFPASAHVRLLKLEKADDISVWKYAKVNDYAIVTKDKDFNGINTLLGFPPKIIWINTGNVSTDNIIDLIKSKSKLINDFLENEKLGILELN